MAALKRAAVRLVVGGVGSGCRPLSLEWDGKLARTLPPPTASVERDLTTHLDGPGLGVDQHRYAFGDLDLSSALTFDPQEPAFRSLAIRLKTEPLGVALDGVGRLESRGLRWGLTSLGPRDGFVERVRLRFNLKRFLDEVLEDTFAPSFSSGEVRFRIGLPCCVERLQGRLRFTKEGFSELGLSFPLPLPREWACPSPRFSGWR